MSGDKLVNADTGEVIAECTPDEARELTDRIGTAMGVAWELVLQAYRTRAWAALGHGSWDAYCAAEFGKFHMRLPSEERDETIASLRSAGLSIRAIAATGVASKKTVERTIAASGVANDDTSTLGADGKTYPAGESAAVRAARERREREAAAEPVDFGKCTAGFDCAAKATAGDGMCAWHRGKAKAEIAEQGSDAPSAPAPETSGKAGAEPPTDAAATGATDGTGQHAPHTDGDGDGGELPPAPPVTPVLPEDWRNRIADAVYLTRCDPEALAVVATADDHADLEALTDWCFQFIQAIKENDE